jgi:hypothetical protein
VAGRKPALVDRDGASRAALVAERQQAADRLADLTVQEANVNAQCEYICRSRAGPALYLAKVFGSNDTEALGPAQPSPAFCNAISL